MSAGAGAFGIRLMAGVALAVACGETSAADRFAALLPGLPGAWAGGYAAVWLLWTVCVPPTGGPFGGLCLRRVRRGAPPPSPDAPSSEGAALFPPSRDDASPPWRAWMDAPSPSVSPEGEVAFVSPAETRAASTQEEGAPRLHKGPETTAERVRQLTGVWADAALWTLLGWGWLGVLALRSEPVEPGALIRTGAVLFATAGAMFAAARTGRGAGARFLLTAGSLAGPLAWYLVASTGLSTSGLFAAPNGWLAACPWAAAADAMAGAGTPGRTLEGGTRLWVATTTMYAGLGLGWGLLRPARGLDT